MNYLKEYASIETHTRLLFGKYVDGERIGNFQLFLRAPEHERGEPKAILFNEWIGV